MQNNNQNYYLGIKPKMMKDFDKMFRCTRRVLQERFDQAKLNELHEESRRAYEELLPRLPYIGGKENSGTFNLVGGAQILAIIRVLEREGFTTRDIGKIIYDTFGEYFKVKPGLVQKLIGTVMTSRRFMEKRKKKAETSQLRQYPGDFVSEFVPGDGELFDMGLDTIECGICKLYKHEDAEKYIPYLCLGDYPMFRALGLGLSRTTTLAHGADRCDFRFKRGGETPDGWPPENLPEWKDIDGFRL